ncbi:MAG: potassium transporter Kup [Burkholderiaceae bacterium]
MASQKPKSSLTVLTLAAVGIVYGDIGTSPLYAMKEVFSEQHGLALSQANLLGVVSLIVWSLIAVVSLKYVTLMLRADNHGEGGIMALLTLTLSSVGKTSRAYFPLLVIGMFGAALFFGDGIITPAISVLSAIEGLEVATPAFKPYVVPLTLMLLTGLYALQKHGTAGIGKWFGPVMVVWFIALAGMGIVNIVAAPEILAALNPLHAFLFMIENSWIAFVALGAIVLVVTGAEALYADMGHFGRKPVRMAWFFITFPALALNYLGQGGLLMHNPAAVTNPFYQQLGDWSIYPLIVLSTVATIIASQATISGTYSMVKQAIALGFLPRMKVIQTSSKEIGQIYIPLVNWMQWGAVVLAVLAFGSSSNLAAAYGIAVTGTMIATTVLSFFVIRTGWKYPLALSICATSFFLVIDVAFFAANALKILHGGWFPLLLGAFMFTVMLTWKRGRDLVRSNLQKHAIPLEDFLASLFTDPPLRVPGLAIFMRGPGDGVPHAMLHNLSHNKVLHERVVFLTVYQRGVPWVPFSERIQIHDLGHNCYQLDMHYGFKNEADIPKALELSREHGFDFNMMETSFFIARQTVIPTPGSGMALWRERLFAGMSRNARDAADYYHIPANRVIELGTQVEI